MKTTLTQLLCAGALAASPLLSHAAAGITDPAGDFLSTFGGSTASTDLDVISASVTYNAAADTFTLSSTMDGAIGTTASGFYVWGVNRGTGTAAFAADGIDGVRFDGVVLVFGNGLSQVIAGGPPVTTGTVTVSGNTITDVISGASLPTPSGGFGNKLDYTWNLWPRDGAVVKVGDGFNQIADFAPDNANFSTTLAAVPEPETYAMMLAGLGVLGWSARRHGAGRPA